MDRLDAMGLFVAAVEEGSLAGAARRHGRSPASVTRAVALLEQQAGEALLFRSTRKLSLTAAGDQRLNVWREVLAKLREVEPDGEIRGSIALTAPELFGRLKLMPLLDDFLADHPQVAARVLLANRLVNLVGEGIDMAVRLAPLPDSTLTAIRVGEVRTLLCAAPEYLANAGSLTDPRDLERHACIGLNVEGDGELWSFDMPSGRERRHRSIRVQPRLSVNNAAATIESALRGRGVIQARSYQVAGHIAEGRLIRLLPEFESAPVPVHLLFSGDRAKNRAVRAAIDYLTPRLRAILSADVL